jgi:DeoR-like helix-turn-helix domain
MSSTWALRFRDELREQIKYINKHQMWIAWVKYLHDCFRDQDTPAGRRQRHLVHDLSEKGKVVPFDEISNISSRLATAYAQKTPRTIRRDIKALESKHLITKTDAGYEANMGIMLGFLPVRRLPSVDDDFLGSAKESDTI